MIIKPQLTFTSFFLLFLCLAWVPSPAFSQSDNAQVKAGHIVVGSGRLLARAADGTERRLRRRAAVYAGDTIVVGKNAFAQIRFTDGGLFSLQPDSEFKVSEYRHQEQANENGKVVFELLKGGLRTISGSIGKKNRENYQLKTPVSTIGIRGTHYGLRLCAGDCISTQGDPVSDGLYGDVADGAIGVTNQTGEGIIGSDEYFYVESIDTPLEMLLGPPDIEVGPVINTQQDESGAGDDASDEGDPSSGGGVGEFPPPDDSDLMYAGGTLDEAFAIEGAPEMTLNTGTGGAVGTEPSDSAAPDQPVNDLSNSANENTILATTTTIVDPFGPLGAGEGPAPLWSAAVIAAEHSTTGGEAHVAAQKDTPESQLYIDSNNNVVRTLHEGPPDCYPCGLDKGTATLTNDSMPTGGFTMLQPGEQVFWGRWENGWQGADSTGVGTGMGSWHFMYSSNVTSMTDLNNLQVNNVVAHFSQWSPGDGTVPTDQARNTGWYAAPPSMDVDFGTREITNYQVGISIGATGYYFSGVQAAPVTFAGPAIDIPLNVSCSGCAMSTGSGNSAILFVGTGASHAINAIEMHTDDFADTALGTALLTRSPPPPP